VWRVSVSVSGTTNPIQFVRPVPGGLGLEQKPCSPQVRRMTLGYLVFGE
jgi:hypothetical protein